MGGTCVPPFFVLLCLAGRRVLSDLQLRLGEVVDVPFLATVELERCALVGEFFDALGDGFLSRVCRDDHLSAYELARRLVDRGICAYVVLHGRFLCVAKRDCLVC